KRGAFYVRRAVEFYSEKVGEYPWPQATALHSALSAGGGMEYPMITVIGNSGDPEDLDDVITHEVGHNWFYGLLASNERDHPFLDEGLNSYYENRYMEQYYSQHEPVELPGILFNTQRNGKILHNGYLLLARERKDTPPDSHSDRFSPMAYGLQVYMKTAMTLKWLEQSIGTARFDRAMQDYYQRWKFRHPYPEDLRASWLQSGLTEQEIGWWFEAMQSQKQADFKITEVEKNDGHDDDDSSPTPPAGTWEIEVKNKGKLQAPFSITALQDGKPVHTEWYTQPGELTFPAVQADRFVVDYEQLALDLNRKNNDRRSGGFMPGMPPMEFRPVAVFQNIRHNTASLLPWFGWNNIDKTMIGAVVYNPPLPPRRFQYYLLPGYALGSRRFVGSADLRYKTYPGGLFPKVTFGLSGKTFDYDYNPQLDYYAKLWRVVPQVRANLRTDSRTFSHALNFRTLFIGRERGTFDLEGDFIGKTWRYNTIHELRYEGEERMLPNPYQFKVALETQAYRDGLYRPAHYVRSTVEWVQKFYYKPGRRVTARAFVGAFLSSTQRKRSIEETALTLNPQGFNDYRFDHTFMARSGGAGILGRQVSQSDGGFKAAFGSPYAAQVGNSNNYVLALNLRADLPKRLPLGLPLRPYFDIGYFDDATPIGTNRPSSEQWLWSGGVLLELFRGRLEGYMPLANSKDLKRLYCEQSGGTNSSAIFCGGNYLKMISWSVNLTLGDPVETLVKVVE
ncbi:MAG TPA: M1 family aminopeptidase, partial [Saprospiraceae bacterium]|nr:M1 family aminopeptidase [Saprospiraceae bacterium]